MSISPISFSQLNVFPFLVEYDFPTVNIFASVVYAKNKGHHQAALLFCLLVFTDYPNGTVDVFRGWVSSIGKAVTAKEVITRTVKVTNVGRPSMAEDRSTVTAATGMTVTPASTSVVKGQSTTLTVAFQPEGATDKSFRAVSADKTKATVSVSGMTITVKGVAAGKVNIPVVSGNGEFAAVAEINVTAS